MTRRKRMAWLAILLLGILLMAGILIPRRASEETIELETSFAPASPPRPEVGERNVGTAMPCTPGFRDAEEERFPNSLWPVRTDRHLRRTAYAKQLLFAYWKAFGTSEVASASDEGVLDS
jgi:hypothetical protein